MNTMTLRSGTLVVVLAAFAITAPAADLHVPADHATIQAAVDAAADGDTIHIAAGVYREQVDINRKDLTLIGEPGTILRAFPNMVQTPRFSDFQVRCVVLIHFSTVTLENLSFEGDQLGADQDADFFGVLYLDSGGTVDGCRFTGFRMSHGNPANAPYEIRALAFVNDLDSASRLEGRVVNSTIVDSYQGIQAIGIGERIVLDMVIENNTIQGVGPTPVNTPIQIVLYGVKLTEGVTGRVTSNTISGFSYNGTDSPFPFNFGILCHGGDYPNFVPVSPIRFEGNTFRDNDVHIGSFKGIGHEIVGNRFERSGEGGRENGVWVSGESGEAPPEIRDNDFREIPVGILGAANDPDYQRNLGTMTGAQIIGNRFRDVAVPVQLQDGADGNPPATATESGTLLYPFPAPGLEIEPAVMISWPDFYQEWSLETSTDGEIWTPLELPVLRVDGEYQVTAPADEVRELFRLIEADEP